MIVVTVFLSLFWTKWNHPFFSGCNGITSRLRLTIINVSYSTVHYASRVITPGWQPFLSRNPGIWKSFRNIKPYYGLSCFTTYRRMYSGLCRPFEQFLIELVLWQACNRMVRGGGGREGWCVLCASPPPPPHHKCKAKYCLLQDFKGIFKNNLCKRLFVVLYEVFFFEKYGESKIEKITTAYNSFVRF